MSDESKIPAPEVASDDNIARNRALPFTDPGSIPVTAAGYRPSEPEEKAFLQRISNKLQAEAVQSLDECIEKGSKLVEDLGKYVPSIETLVKLRTLKKQSNAAKAKIAALNQYIQEKDDILNNDISVALKQISKELQHEIETNNPQLAGEYPDTILYTKSHGESIREGKEKAKQLKENK